MGEIKRIFGNKYNNWAFEIIEKESGGHKGITNISGLGTLGIMPKRKRERLKELQALKKRVSELKTVGRGKLSDEDKEKLATAQKMLKSTEIPEDEKAYYEKLEKILMPTMEKLMPKKAREMQVLLNQKEAHANKRKAIMNEIEDQFVKAFKKFFNASTDIPVMGKRSDVKIPGGEKEYALESFMEELKS